MANNQTPTANDQTANGSEQLVEVRLTQPVHAKREHGQYGYAPTTEIRRAATALVGAGVFTVPADGRVIIGEDEMDACVRVLHGERVGAASELLDKAAEKVAKFARSLTQEVVDRLTGEVTDAQADLEKLAPGADVRPVERIAYAVLNTVDKVYSSTQIGGIIADLDATTGAPLAHKLDAALATYAQNARKGLTELFELRREAFAARDAYRTAQREQRGKQLTARITELEAAGKLKLPARGKKDRRAERAQRVHRASGSGGEWNAEAMRAALREANERTEAE